MTNEVTVDRDYQPLKVRRNMRAIVCGFAYDTETASLIKRDEHIARDDRWFHGQALYMNVYGKYFLHSYHQWDRFNSIEPLTIAKAIEWCEKYCPEMIEGHFGWLPEEGGGKPYTPIVTGENK